MPKTIVHHARLSKASFQDVLKLDDLSYETPKRLYEVLNEEFYMSSLTQELAKLHPDVFIDEAPADATFVKDRHKKVECVGKFEIDPHGQVRLLDIAFN